MKEQLLRKKDIASILKDSLQEKGGLKRTLSVRHLIALGIGAIIGTGIFVLTGTAAANYAGPALTISFIILVTKSTSGFEVQGQTAGSAFSKAFQMTFCVKSCLHDRKERLIKNQNSIL